MTTDEIFDVQTSDMPVAATPGKGREIFEKRCASCHRFGNMGRPDGGGPDLTHANARPEKGVLLEAILWPSREVAEGYRPESVDLADGSTLEAIVLREDDKVLLLKTAGEPRPITIGKGRVAARRRLEKSIMPEGLLDGYDQGAVASLLELLATAPQ